MYHYIVALHMCILYIYIYISKRMDLEVVHFLLPGSVAGGHSLRHFAAGNCWEPQNLLVFCWSIASNQANGRIYQGYTYIYIYIYIYAFDGVIAQIWNRVARIIDESQPQGGSFGVLGTRRDPSCQTCQTRLVRVSELQCFIILMVV